LISEGRTAPTPGVIGNVANSGASGGGATRPIGAGVSLRTIGWQQSGVGAPIPAWGGEDRASPAAQQGPLRTQQYGVSGTPVARTTIATARVQAARPISGGCRPLLDGMDRG